MYEENSHSIPQGKRRYGLNLIRTKLKEISENKIAMSFFVMNKHDSFIKSKKGVRSKIKKLINT